MTKLVFLLDKLWLLITTYGLNRSRTVSGLAGKGPMAGRPQAPVIRNLNLKAWDSREHHSSTQGAVVPKQEDARVGQAAVEDFL